MGGREHFQRLRLVEILAMDEQEYLELHRRMQSSMSLPRTSYHFQAHGVEFEGLGIGTEEEYLSCFRTHVMRQDLLYFSYFSSKAPYYRMWLRIAMDDGVVVQYNEDRKRHWSMYRPATLFGFLAVDRGWWVSVSPYDQQGASRW